MSLVVSRRIAAPREVIWSLLTSGDRLSGGDFGVARVHGQIESGRVVLVSFADEPRHSYPIRIDVAEPPRELLLRFRLPFGMLKGSVAVLLLSVDKGTEVEVSLGLSGLLGVGTADRLETLREPVERFLAMLDHALTGGLGPHLERLRAGSQAWEPGKPEAQDI